VTRAEELAGNLATVQTRVLRATLAAGRPADAVTLLAVSKNMPAQDVAHAMAAGQLDFGENYAQELRDKRQELAGIPPRWHFIGPLQSNKVKYVAGLCSLIHSLDTVELLAEVNRRVPDGQVQECLLQVNVAAEPQKRGVAPAALPALLDAFATLPRLRCRGLMVIPPASDDPQGARPHFAALRELRDREAAHQRPGVELAHLSMGMSHDLEAAISEGATIVRVGTAIFGERRRPA
jgi:pyridoxal phosphate enzyme (YggS family)